MGRLAELAAKEPPPTESHAGDGEDVLEAEPSELNQRYQRFLTNVVDRWVSLDPSAVTAVAGPRNWLAVGSGRSGISFVWSLAFARSVRVEVYIDVGDRDENKRLFDLLREDAERIESTLGEELLWERLDDRKASRISQSRDIDPVTFDSDPQVAEWAAESMVKLDRVFRPAIQALE